MGTDNEQAWIEVVGESEAEGYLCELYEAHRSPQTGTVDNILKIHSLHPQTLADHEQLYRTLMFASGGLSRPEREMIGVLVSAANRCHY